jgi:two-component system, LuxR family, response regulator FixJ
MTARTVYVVDDDEAVRDSLAALLASAGYRVVAHATARSLLDSDLSASEACILLDVRLPDMNGLSLKDELARRGVDLPVILITGHGDVPMAVRAMQAGAVDFIEKPCREEVLLGSLERAFGRRPQAGEPAGAGDDEPTSRLARLTPREREVFERLAQGKANKVIAAELGISPRTVEVHRARVMAKLGARSLADVVRLGLGAGSGRR